MSRDAICMNQQRSPSSFFHRKTKRPKPSDNRCDTGFFVSVSIFHLHNVQKHWNEFKYKQKEVKSKKKWMTNTNKSSKQTLASDKLMQESHTFYSIKSKSVEREWRRCNFYVFLHVLLAAVQIFESRCVRGVNRPEWYRKCYAVRMHRFGHFNGYLYIGRLTITLSWQSTHCYRIIIASSTRTAAGICQQISDVP